MLWVVGSERFGAGFDQHILVARFKMLPDFPAFPVWWEMHSFPWRFFPEFQHSFTTKKSSLKLDESRQKKKHQTNHSQVEFFGVGISLNPKLRVEKSQSDSLAIFVLESAPDQNYGKICCWMYAHFSPGKKCF